MYCTLDQIKTYLGLTSSQTSDDELLTALLSSAEARINSLCGRQFWSNYKTRYFNPSENILRGELWLDEDLSHIASVVNGDSADITAQVSTRPSNYTPYYALNLKTSSTATWEYETDAQNAIAVTGYWSFMERQQVTLSRASNIVTVSYSGNLIKKSDVIITSASDASFDGQFTLDTASGSTLTWEQTGADVSGVTATLLYTPQDILTAARRLTAWMYRQKDTQQGDQDRPLLAGDGTVIMPSTLPQDVLQILKPYIKME